MSHDVIVCGGGTAGTVAAIAAARQGAKTLIVEQFGFLGGSQTGALVLPMMSFTTGGVQLVTGLCQEIIDRCDALPGDNEGIFFNPELLKYVLEDMVLEAGCEVRYHTFVWYPTPHVEWVKTLCSRAVTGTSDGWVRLVVPKLEVPEEHFDYLLWIDVVLEGKGRGWLTDIDVDLVHVRSPVHAES